MRPVLLTADCGLFLHRYEGVLGSRRHSSLVTESRRDATSRYCPKTGPSVKNRKSFLHRDEGVFGSRHMTVFKPCSDAMPLHVTVLRQAPL